MASDRARESSWGRNLLIGVVVASFAALILVPSFALASKALEGGFRPFWDALMSADARRAFVLTLWITALATVVNTLFGLGFAMVLVRQRFWGRALADGLVDLPFALPTIVAGLVLLALYGATSPLHLNLAYTQASVVVALLFVTLPFVVRTVQPVLLELDRDMEQAAYSLGASPGVTFRRVILPNLLPAMLSGAGDRRETFATKALLLPTQRQKTRSRGHLGLAAAGGMV